jgi:hypothetical protein
MKVSFNGKFVKIGQFLPSAIILKTLKPVIQDGKITSRQETVILQAQKINLHLKSDD